MKNNVYLIFGIDFRSFLSDGVLDKTLYENALSRMDILLRMQLLYGDGVFPQGFQVGLRREDLLRMKQNFQTSDYRYIQALEADGIVREYLTDLLGNLVIRKKISTATKITCCGYLGISEEIFDSYVSYREERDTQIRLYPYHLGK